MDKPFLTTEAKRLEMAHTALQNDYEVINRQLKKANLELKQKSLELNITSNYFNSIVNSMSQGLLVVNLDGIITTFNPASGIILNINPSEVLFRQFKDFFTDDFFGFSMERALNKVDAPKILCITVENSKGPVELEIETTFVLKNLSIDEKNVAMGILILIRDVTETHRLETIVNRNDHLKELGEMAALVAHEIRNPLGGIKGFASLLLRDLNDQPELREMALNIVKGTDDLNRLVTNVVNYACAQPLVMETTDLCALLKELIHHVKMDDALGQISLEEYFPPNALVVDVDPGAIKSAILNLIVNSREAMSNGGTLTLKLEDAKDKVRVIISDTGEGIPEENMPHLFKPFYTTKKGGHGFGLAEVHRIIHAHDGFIEVESTLGYGTTFIITLKKTRSSIKKSR